MIKAGEREERKTIQIERKSKVQDKKSVTHFSITFIALKGNKEKENNGTPGN